MVEEQIIKSVLLWDGIEIEITYTPNWHYMLSQTDVVSHIELRSKERIPVTETGYRSMFFYQHTSSIIPSVDDMIVEYLDDAAQSKEWQRYRKQKQQLSLF